MFDSIFHNKIGFCRFGPLLAQKYSFINHYVQHMVNVSCVWIHFIMPTISSVTFSVHFLSCSSQFVVLHRLLLAFTRVLSWPVTFLLCYLEIQTLFSSRLLFYRCKSCKIYTLNYPVFLLLVHLTICYFSFSLSV